jgi:hypothetical protein
MVRAMRSRRAWIIGGLAGALLAAGPAAGDTLEPSTPGDFDGGSATQSASPATPSRHSDVQAAARALRRDPLYVAPSGVDPKVALGAEDRQAVRAQLARLRPPLFVAVLPAAGEPTAILDQVARATGRDGTYLVVTGRTLRAQSNVLPAGAIAEITREAFDARRDQGLAAVLRQTFDAVRAITSGGLVATSEPDAGDGVPTIVVVLAAIAGGVAALFALIMLLIRRQARRVRRQGPDTGPAFWSSGAYRSLGGSQGTTSDSTWITGAAGASTFDSSSSSSSSSSDSSSSASSDSGGGSFDSGSSGDSGGSF